MTTYDFDPEAAAAELRSLAAVTNVAAQAAGRDVIKTAALVDIAASLRTLSLESSLAMRDAGVFGIELHDSEEAMDTDEFFGDEPIDLTDADAGTLVELITDPDDAAGPRRGVLTGNGGVSEGQPWVGVAWLDEVPELHEYDAVVGEPLPELEGAPEHRIFMTHLVGIPGGEPLVTVEPEIVDAVAWAAELSEREADVEPATEAGDIDADFDGDTHTAAVDAVATLKAARKGAKKGTKK